MGATYLWHSREDGREEVEVESSAIGYGILVSGPGGFPQHSEGSPTPSRRWWSAAAWLEWAGHGAYWESVEEDLD